MHAFVCTVCRCKILSNLLHQSISAGDVQLNVIILFILASHSQYTQIIALLEKNDIDNDRIKQWVWNYVGELEESTLMHASHTSLLSLSSSLSPLPLLSLSSLEL